MVTMKEVMNGKLSHRLAKLTLMPKTTSAYC